MVVEQHFSSPEQPSAKAATASSTSLPAALTEMSISVTTSPALTTSSSWGSTALTSLASSASIPTPALITALPTEVLLRVFAQLSSPLDLYHASLANTTWRSIARDPRLWEVHYWTFYRAPYDTQTEQDRLLLKRRTVNRHCAMRAWIEAYIPRGSPGRLGPLVMGTAAGNGMKMYRPLAEGLRPLCTIQDDSAAGLAALRERLHQLNEEDVRKGPSDAQEVTNRILSTLYTEFGDPLNESAKDEWKARLADYAELPPKPHTLPHFLTVKAKREDESSAAFPDFHSLFVKRMNTDERLLLALRTHLGLDCGILDSQLRLIEEFGDGARDLLAALCADQKVTPDNVGRFASSPGEGGYDSKSKKRWPRALDVHHRAAAGSSQPRLGHCLALYHVAERLLSHLQRREAVRSMGKLQQRFHGPPLKAQTSLAERILEYGRGAEEALSDIALFRYGDRGEIQEYLDLLALYVWADHDAGARWDDHFVSIGPSDGESVDDGDGKTPPGSTRYFITTIETSLRRLGFGVATKADNADPEGDYDDFFINSSLFCPGQRATSPLTYMAILCFVATRLGIPMALTQTPSHSMAVVLEQTDEPEGGWSGGQEGKEWSRFYYMPSSDGRWCLLEGNSLGTGNPADQAAIEAGRQLASPVMVLGRAGLDMRNNQHGRKAWAGIKDIPDSEMEIANPAAASHPRLRELRDYLTGESATLPWPLAAAIMPSSLTFLPSTKAKTPRVDSLDLKGVTSYCAAWALNYARKPRNVTGWHQIHQPVYNAITKEELFFCDIALLLEATGGNVSSELAAIRRRPKNGNVLKAFFNSMETSDGVQQQRQQERAPAAVREFVALALSNDAEPNDGVGGEGAAVGKGGKRDPELLKHSHPLNRAVEHGIGTVFVHRTFKYRAVIVGWDAAGSAEIGRRVGMDFNTLRSGGIDQPFYHVYHEDGTRRYVAQCDVEVSRVPAGSTVEEATAILRPYVPLFNLWRVQQCFRAVSVNPWKAKVEETDDVGKGGRGGVAGGGGGSGGAIRLLMTPWMRKAWPDG